VSNKSRRTILDYIFFTRPVLMPPVWTIALLGTQTTAANTDLSLAQLGLFLFQLACLSAAIYTLNQIADVESDRLNDKLFFLADGIIGIGSARVFSIALHLTAIVIAWTFGTTYTLLTITGLVLGLMYSTGTYPLKDHPLPGLFANMIGHGAIVYLLGAVSANVPVESAVLSPLSYALAVGAVYLATTVPDMEGDRTAGKLTMPVWIGPRPTMFIASMLVTLALILALWTGDWHLLIPAILVLPLFVIAIWRDGASAARAAIAAVGFLTLAAVWAYPAYAILLILGFIGTRFFFIWRFGMAYPTFSPRK